MVVAMGVRVITINNVMGHELVQHPGDELDAEEAANEAPHHYEASVHVVPSILLQVLCRLGQHAMQRGEYLCVCGSVSMPGICEEAHVVGRRGDWGEGWGRVTNVP